MDIKKVFKSAPLWVIVLTIFIPLVLVFSTHLIVCQNLADTFLWMKEYSEFVLFEWVIVFGSTWFLYGIFGSLALCCFVVATPYTILTLISYYKQIINGVPLFLGDFKMAGQFFEIAKFALPQVSFSACTIWGIAIPLLLTGALVIADYKLKCRKSRLVFLGGGFIGVLLFFVSTIFPTWAVMIDDENKFQEQRLTEYGPFMGLYCTYAQGRMSREIYNEEAINRIVLQKEKASGIDLEQEETTPTVIFLMSESFFDVSKLDNVEFRPDPVKNFHNLQKKYSSGEFISSAFCGGTGYVEMEVMTGICSNLLKAGDAITYLEERDVYKRIPSISDVFKSYGYKTVFLHSYTSELYNRRKIYRDFGFDEVMFEERFTKAEIRGGYISDMALAEKIIDEYEEKGKEKLFLFAISMENHQPYSAGKFDKSHVKIKSDLLDDDEIGILDAYVNGVYDADKALNRLVRYFSGKKEKVMIVFFGDHMPNLTIGEEESIFSKLGYINKNNTTEWNSNELKKMLTTDYLIWTNYKQEKNDKTESSTFLGVSVLQRLGLDMTDYYDWLSERILPDMLMYRSRLFIDENGKDFANVPEEDKKVIDDYAVAVYDIIYGDNAIFGNNREIRKERIDYNENIFSIGHTRFGILCKKDDGEI